MSFMAKVWLAFDVLKRWEVLVSIAAIILIGLLMGAIANPSDRVPRVVVPRTRAPKRQAAAAKPEAIDEENEDDAPQNRDRRRRSALEDEDEEE
jgi:hypothetical protein